MKSYMDPVRRSTKLILRSLFSLEPMEIQSDREIRLFYSAAFVNYHTLLRTSREALFIYYIFFFWFSSYVTGCNATHPLILRVKIEITGVLYFIMQLQSRVWLQNSVCRLLIFLRFLLTSPRAHVPSFFVSHRENIGCALYSDITSPFVLRQSMNKRSGPFYSVENRFTELRPVFRNRYLDTLQKETRISAFRWSIETMDANFSPDDRY